MRKPVAVYTDVVDTDPAPGVKLLEEAGFTVRFAASAAPADIVAAAADADALLLGYAEIDRPLLEALPAVRIVATQSVGYDMVDLDACRERGIWVTNVPGAATEEVASHALAMTLALLRGLPYLDRDVRAGIWDGTRHDLRRLSEVTVGVVGLGRIGRRYAEYVRPLVGRIVGYDPAVTAMHGVQWLALDELLACSDVVSLHLPLTAETRGLLDARRLGLMREGASLVNVSRAGLIDHRALVRCLDEGRLSGAALDVLPQEPPEPGDPILAHPRVLLTPHAAYLSAASSRDYVLQQAENVVLWHARGRPVSVVVEGRPMAPR
ncbi:C-terminal binding protein [Thermomonospora curvata]|uniref:D-isomer specific 2-hydroxyacid dehydrogenase NAD-binding protein n=1 Tax=Thermomonospora curvata (strain ATCC 19995 / DSM 43183 / JCM 3096 / KCTC 9072 / NBRC 15933 / NCIMB 10081 / Henssen B9) TaxID=471852 RepID=D1A2M9_THECD|nr:C-terminal binding protein [Thermomonospora curvata]ACY96049.1 D-isomer specific 2-hydroxyacid dehydrogenase NAD-binding protein [Thermomonospora curvata DSM 43183]